jgi:hypothetical protein
MLQSNPNLTFDNWITMDWEVEVAGSSDAYSGICLGAMSESGKTIIRKVAERDGVWNVYLPNTNTELQLTPRLCVMTMITIKMIMFFTTFVTGSNKTERLKWDSILR